jgi:uncharacterized protein DUF2817
MAWLRRFNENNVDLNRNFLAPEDKFEGAPEGYENLDAFLNPATPPSRDLFYLRAAALLARHGSAALKGAIAGGQYVNPKGLFFGGQRLEQGPAVFQQYLTDHLAGVERILAIDIHTGLGPFGDDRLLVDVPPDRDSVYQSMAEVFGQRVQRLNGASVAYEFRGAQQNLYSRLFPGAQLYFVTQEFGTYPPLRVLEALRSENRWHHYGGGGTVDHPVKTKLRKMFNPDDEGWRRLVLTRGRELIAQGLKLAFGH